MNRTTEGTLDADQRAYLHHRLLGMLDHETGTADDPDGDGRPPPNPRDAIELAEALRDALAKLDHGTYGLCETCQAPMPFERLDAVPYARHCVPCQQRPRNLFG